VDYKIDVIEQHPLRLVVALNVRRPFSRATESLLYLIRDGLNLPRVATRADDKKICERAGRFVQLKNRQVFGFFVFARVNRFQYLGSAGIDFPGHSTSSNGIQMLL
jgi:hypothetical protein